MRISDVTADRSGRGVSLRATVHPDATDEPLTVWFRVHGGEKPLPEGGDPFVVGFLTTCMFEGEDIQVEAPVSSALLESLNHAQNVLLSWYGDLRPVEIIAAETVPAAPEHPPNRALGCCFSGGVDSWYSLLKHEREITDLLLIQGFDIANDNTVLWEAATERALRVARDMGKRMITVATNLRTLADKRRCGWGRRFHGDFWGQVLHGSAIASVGLVLRNEFPGLIIPATHMEGRLPPWGSSPLLDPYWSDGRVRFVHDGCEASRVEKVRRIASSELALQTLRVCYCNTEHLNCCVCEKCCRTMMALRACGALERSTSFPIALDLRTACRMTVPPNLLPRYGEILDAAESVGDRELARACRIILGRSFSADRTLRLGWRRMRETLRAFSLRPA